MIKINNCIFLLSVIFAIILLCVIYYRMHIKLPEVKYPEISVLGEDESQENMEPYPPCNSFGKMKWFHDTATGECYEEGTAGPCGELMTFYQHPGKAMTSFGFCDCDDVVEVKSNRSECESVERPLIYFAPQERCFTVYSQGPCAPEEWFVLDKSLNPICEKNRCLHKNVLEDEFSLKFWILNEGKCYKTTTRGYCNKGEFLKVTKYDWKPSCQKDLVRNCPISSTVSSPSLECRSGSKIHQLNMCKMSHGLND